MSSRTHVVTGAGSGIGQLLADRLVERGDRVVLVARSEERARELEQRYGSAAGGAVTTVVADLAVPGQVVAAGRRLAERLDSVDSLVHCAGVVDLGRVDSLDPAQWQRQLDVNLTAPALLTRALLPAVRAARGTVLFVNSTSGLSASPQWSAYAASKFGLRALADVLRAEEAEHGVRVTSVFPSRTATPMQAQVHEQEGNEYDPSTWMQADSVVATILHALDLPGDAVVPEVVIRTAPSPSQH